MRVLSVICALSVAFSASAKPLTSELPSYSFDAYLKEYKKTYPNRDEYNKRKALFEQRVQQFVAHNNNNKSYTLNVNKFADMTEEEIHQFKGYNAAAGREHARTRAFTRDAPHEKHGLKALPDSLDWRTKGAITPVKNQAACGSCWAFGSAETLESHTFLHGSGELLTLSEQQLVDCAPNPNDCGGKGGCEGSIPELAYGYIKDAGGLALEKDYRYRGADEICKKSVPKAANVTGFVNVQSNNYTAVMLALQEGPLAVTVDAGPWTFYDSGVFTDCDQDSPALDHVVQLVGYGKDDESNKDFWIVRNSWGNWGESGYIRMERHADSSFCGIDTNPADGTGCKGGPSTVKACGSCGILYDAVYPLVK